MRYRAILAYTVVELLVAMGVLVILSVAFTFLLSMSRSSSDGGLKNIEVRSLHRTTQQRITTLVRSAIAPNEVDPAIVSPEYQQTDTQLRFHAPTNLLDSALPFDLRAPDYPEFTLSLRPTTGDFLVARSDGTGDPQRFGRGFTSVEFERVEKTVIKFTLSSEYEVRGDAGVPKKLRATSANMAQLPGVF